MKKKISGMLDLPKEIVLNLPVINILGSEEMSVENYKGIIEYTEAQIRVSTQSGILRVDGKRLLLKQITAESISITGKIDRIEFIQ